MKIPRHSDSMELLLDAMCNVFGVILLIAILLGSAETVKAIIAPSGTVPLEVNAKAQSRLQLLQSQLKLTELERSWLQTLPQPEKKAVDPRSAQLLKSYQKLAQELNQAADELDSLQSKVANLQSQLEKAASSPEPPEAPPSEPPVLQLPGSMRTAGLQPWRLLATKNGVYTIGSNQMIRHRSSRSPQVHISQFSANGVDFYRITPQKNKAVKLQDYRLLLPEDSENKYFVEILAEPGSIAQTALLIRYLRKNQILYHWRITSGNGALLRTAAGGKYEVSR